MSAVSTNLDSSAGGTWAPELLCDRDALFERSQPIVFTRDKKALWEWAIFLGLTTDLLRDSHYRGKSIPMKVLIEAMNLFTTGVHRWESISPRTLKQIAQWLHRFQSGDISWAITEREITAMLLGAGLVTFGLAAGSALIVWLGSWPAGTGAQRLEIIGWCALGGMCGMGIVIVSLAIGGPVGRFTGKAGLIEFEASGDEHSSLPG